MGREKGFAHIVIIILIFVVAGLLVYSGSKKDEDISQSDTYQSKVYTLPRIFTPTTPALKLEKKPQENNKPIEWQTYTNTKYGYQFDHPEYFADDVPDCSVGEFDDDYVWLFGCDSLVISVEPIQTDVTDPLEWWEGQTVESYTDKPVSCFSHKTTNTIESNYEENDTVIEFGREVLVLNDFYTEDENCYEPPSVQILLIPHNGGFLKVAYDWAIMSEEILSTFVLIE